MVKVTYHIFSIPIVRRNGSPAFECCTCGFVWQPHMRKPKSECEDILAKKKGVK